jgi:hypothetical protein
MHHRLLVAACGACLSWTVAAGGHPTLNASSGTASAQSQTTRPPQTAPSSQVVMTGCVERADQLVPAGGNATGTTVDSLDFVLTHAQVSDSPHPSSPGAIGTSGTRSGGAVGDNGIGAMYKLDGEIDTINPHVGHRVEITGTREPSGTGARPPSSTAINPSAANVPAIKVVSLRLLSETCAR